MTQTKEFKERLDIQFLPFSKAEGSDVLRQLESLPSVTECSLAVGTPMQLKETNHVF